MADDLAAANAKLEQAKLEHHRARQVVVSKGVERAARLADLQKEIAAEQEQVSAVIESASKGG